MSEGGGFRSMGRQANMVRRAMGGDSTAAFQLVSEALDVHRSKVMDLRRELDHYHAHDWTEGAERTRAFEGEVSGDEVVGAFSTVYKQILFISAAVPLILMGPEEEREAYEAEIRSAVYDLFIMLHNPQVRYAIVGGFREEVREDVDDYLDRMGLSMWGTIEAVLSEGDATVDDFPPETAAVIELMRERIEAQQQEG